MSFSESKIMRYFFILGEKKDECILDPLRCPWDSKMGILSPGLCYPCTGPCKRSGDAWLDFLSSWDKLQIPNILYIQFA